MNPDKLLPEQRESLNEWNGMLGLIAQAQLNPDGPLAQRVNQKLAEYQAMVPDYLQLEAHRQLVVAAFGSDQLDPELQDEVITGEFGELISAYPFIETTIRQHLFPEKTETPVSQPAAPKPVDTSFEDDDKTEVPGPSMNVLVRAQQKLSHQDTLDIEINGQIIAYPQSAYILLRELAQAREASSYQLAELLRQKGIDQHIFKVNASGERAVGKYNYPALFGTRKTTGNETKPKLYTLNPDVKLTWEVAINRQDQIVSIGTQTIGLNPDLFGLLDYMLENANSSINLAELAQSHHLTENQVEQIYFALLDTFPELANIMSEDEDSNLVVGNFIKSEIVALAPPRRGVEAPLQQPPVNPRPPESVAQSGLVFLQHPRQAAAVALEQTEIPSAPELPDRRIVAMILAQLGSHIAEFKKHGLKIDPSSSVVDGLWESMHEQGMGEPGDVMDFFKGLSNEDRHRLGEQALDQIDAILQHKDRDTLIKTLAQTDAFLAMAIAYFNEAEQLTIYIRALRAHSESIIVTQVDNKQNTTIEGRYIDRVRMVLTSRLDSGPSHDDLSLEEQKNAFEDPDSAVNALNKAASRHRTFEDRNPDIHRFIGDAIARLDRAIYTPEITVDNFARLLSVTNSSIRRAEQARRVSVTRSHGGSLSIEDAIIAAVTVPTNFPGGLRPRDLKDLREIVRQDLAKARENLEKK